MCTVFVVILEDNLWYCTLDSLLFVFFDFDADFFSMNETSPNDDNPLVCFCFGITQQEILAVIEMDEVETVMDITDHCKAGNGCSSCWPLLGELLALKPPRCS